MEMEWKDDGLTITVHLAQGDSQRMAQVAIGILNLLEAYENEVDHNQLADPEWLSGTGLVSQETLPVPSRR
jgi:hypothetical protein